MKSKTMILMVVAIGCGLAASYMTSRLLAERANEKDQEQEKVTILVAKQNLSMGTLVKDPERYFQEKQFTKGEEPRKALTSFDQIKEKKLNKSLAAEQFVTGDDLMDSKSANFENQMPPGTLAVAIKVSVDAIAGGFVQPNSHVDVITTLRRSDGEATSHTLLQNMLVLAVGETPIRDTEKQTILASTVTLAAKPDEAQKLILAQDLGNLKLILRKYDDLEVRKVKVTTSRDIAKSSGATAGASGSDDDGSGNGGKTFSGIPDVPGGAQVTPGKEPEPVVKPPKTHTLTIYNGESVTKAIFTESEVPGGEANTQVLQPDQPAKPSKKEDDSKAGKKEEDTKATTGAKPVTSKTETK